jgi:threonine/homoserine/homoserine lactone efflux protein
MAAARVWSLRWASAWANPRWVRAQRYVSGGMLISLGVATAFAGSTNPK